MVDFFDILIVSKGDYFIIVSGKFIPSCFGNSIEHLCKLGNNSVLKNQIESDPQNYFPIPKELISLIEKIKSLKVFHQRSISNFFNIEFKISDLFIEGQESTTNEINEIKNILDSGKDLKNWNGSINSLFDCLIQFLDSLSTSISNQKNQEIKPWNNAINEELKKHQLNDIEALNCIKLITLSI